MNRFEGYITTEGQFIDVKDYKDTVSNHRAYCKEHNIKEYTLLNEYLWVKLTLAIDHYIFQGRYLTPEQIRTLRELGYEPDEYDIL